jgi:hypothetical protein
MKRPSIRERNMMQLTSPSTFQELRAAIMELSPQDLMILHEEIEEKLQTVGMMQLSESGFQEWNDKEEDIYNVEP